MRRGILTCLSTCVLGPGVEVKRLVVGVNRWVVASATRGEGMQDDRMTREGQGRCLLRLKRLKQACDERAYDGDLLFFRLYSKVRSSTVSCRCSIGCRGAFVSSFWTSFDFS